MSDDYLFDRAGEVDPEVERLEGTLAPLRYVAKPLRAVNATARPPKRGAVIGFALMLAAALGAIAAVVGTGGLSTTHVATRSAESRASSFSSTAAAGSLEVARVEGAPRIAHDAFGATGRLGVGDWLETDGASRARIQLAGLGVVDVGPSTRLRLDATGPGEQRLDLARGVISARVDAPPRLFVVGIPSAAAVDLGCAYKLEVGDDGAAWLHVTSGYVSLEGARASSLVPAGAACRTSNESGPGTPRFADAPPELVNAVDRFDATGDDADVMAALPAARARDSLTLWHLLLRVSPEARRALFDRLRSLVTPPQGVEQHAAEHLDREALRPYEKALRSSW